MKSTELINLIKNDNESETIEYKTGLKDAKTIGQYISALGNSALAANIPYAYLIWGVKDLTKEIVGTDFDPYTEKAIVENKKGKSNKSNISLTFYLNKFIDPKLNLIWDKCEIREENGLLDNRCSAFKSTIEVYGDRLYSSRYFKPET